MKGQIRQKEIKFPKNREYSEKLQRGDRAKIAELSGHSVTTVRDMLSGYRRISDKAAKAIIRVINDRNNLNLQLESLIGQQN